MDTNILGNKINDIFGFDCHWRQGYIESATKPNHVPYVTYADILIHYDNPFPKMHSSSGSKFPLVPIQLCVVVHHTFY